MNFWLRTLDGVFCPGRLRSVNFLLSWWSSFDCVLCPWSLGSVGGFGGGGTHTVGWGGLVVDRRGLVDWRGLVWEGLRWRTLGVLMH